MHQDPGCEDLQLLRVQLFKSSINLSVILLINWSLDKIEKSSQMFDCALVSEYLVYHPERSDVAKKYSHLTRYEFQNDNGFFQQMNW